MRYLKQSTATAILLGPFLDDTDGKTAETSLTVASIDVDLYKASDTHPLTKTDITPAASGSNNDMAHVANGFYSLELTATNTDTVGRCVITANISGALPVWHEFMVLPTQVYDSLIGGSDKLQVHADEITNGLITAAAIATNAIDADAIAADAVTEIQSGLATPTNITAGTITTVTNLTNAPTNGDLTATMKTSVTTAATAATPTAAAVTGAVGSVTGNVGGNVAGSVGTVNALAANSVTAAALATDAVAELIAAVFANDLESGKTFAQAILDLWAKSVGDAAANDADDPTSVTYDSPDGTVQVTHTQTGTTRTKV